MYSSRFCLAFVRFQAWLIYSVVGGLRDQPNPHIYSLAQAGVEGAIPFDLSSTTRPKPASKPMGGLPAIHLNWSGLVVIGPARFESDRDGCEQR